MPNRKYRKTIGKGIVPKGDKAWCVHCDEWKFDDDDKPLGRVPCDPSGCDCKCHTQLRKPKCLCAVVVIENPWDSPLGCCEDCDCFCHVAEQKEADRTSKARKASWEAEIKRRDKERFDKEGVHDWEKQVFEYLMLDPRGLNFKYRTYVEAISFSTETKKAIGGKKETGTQFMERMLATPWGSTYAQVQRMAARR